VSGSLAAQALSIKPSLYQVEKEPVSSKFHRWHVYCDELELYRYGRVFFTIVTQFAKFSSSSTVGLRVRLSPQRDFSAPLAALPCPSSISDALHGLGV
jgi:hypothetical protein